MFLFCGSFYDSISRLGEDLERRGHCLTEVLSRRLLRRPDEYYENPTETRPTHLPNAMFLYATVPYLRKTVWTALVTRLHGLRAMHFPCTLAPHT
jgi:hypothetical protein